MTLNSINIIGNLASDIADRLRTVTVNGEERSVLTFPIAVDDAGNLGTDGKTGYFDVTCWGKTADNVVKYLGKGSKVAVEGQLRQHRWEKDGSTNYKVEIANARVIFLGSKNGNSAETAEQVGEAATPAPAAPVGTDDDIPF